ncbi:hypothetical protein A3L23_02102 [Rhodococcoides fascians D188]|jgi:hypothetical protein|nr:hypothetical protein A3L23_02102 [Rhodococcus fascians D188]
MSSSKPRRELTDHDLRVVLRVLTGIHIGPEVPVAAESQKPQTPRFPTGRLDPRRTPTPNHSRAGGN